MVPPPVAPSRLGKYDVRAKLAEGGMASIYVGTLAAGAGGPDDPPVVALKVIREDLSRSREFVNMLVDEASLLERLRHPNIVSHYRLGVEGSRVFLAMELLVGQSLWDVWQACRDHGVRLRYDLLAWVGARVADGLHFAHETKGDDGRPLGIVHRDVNQTNVFVTYAGGVKLLDFGLAKAESRLSKTASGVIKGKVAYMAPEQARGGPIDRRADLFALGVMLWELATDRRLFKQADDIETLKRVSAAQVPDPLTLVAGFPPALWAILRRALARDPDQRYPTAQALAHDLDAFSRSEGRTLDKAMVADAMRSLFPDDAERQFQWIAEASGGGRTALPLLVTPRSGDDPKGPPLSARSERTSIGSSDLLSQRNSHFSPPSRPPELAPVRPRDVPTDPRLPVRPLQEVVEVRASEDSELPPPPSPGLSRGALALIALVGAALVVGLVALGVSLLR